jgi:hypothetical protein
VQAQTQSELSAKIIADSLQTKPDTLKSFLLKKEQPFLYSQQFHNQSASIFSKILLGTGYVFSYNTCMGLFLVLAPANITMWGRDDKFKLPVILSQYRSTFTKPPVFDHDLWYINYVGHPYQGAYYYNSIRSQGATVFQSSLFCLGQSFLWEYVWEGGMEQPSIQDLIVTPVFGALLGELSHVATLQMSKNGYTWFEKVLVCIINPSYAINNGFKTHKKQGF